METNFTSSPIKRHSNVIHSWNIPIRIPFFLMKKTKQTLHMEPTVLPSGTKAPFRSLYLFIIFLLSGLLLLNTGVNGQTANKRLYLKTGQSISRMLPTATIPQATNSIIKSPAVFVKSTSIVSAGNGSPGSALISNYAVEAGSNRLLIVTIASEGTPAITSVTYGTQSLTLLTSQNTTGFRSEIWYLLLGTSGSSTTANVTVNFSGTMQYGIGVSNFHTVNQIVPFGLPYGQSFTNQSDVSFTVPSAQGDFIVDVVGVLATGGNGNNFQPNFNTTGQSVIFRETTSKFRVGSSYKSATASTTAMGWTNPVAGNWAVSAVSLKGITNTESFIQNPTLCNGFTIKAGQNISVLANAAVTSGTASGTTLPMVVRLYHGTNLILEILSADNSGLGATGTTGTLTWSGSISSDYTIPAGGALTAVFSSDYPGTNIRIDYDASTKISYIQLPTSTYIHVAPDLVYDAAYSSGTAITQRSVGYTNYLRAVVSDPFGSDDITGLNFSINGGTPIAGTLVNTAGCTKTYEYVWTPAVAGTYSVSATATEGTETPPNQVTHTATQSFNVVPPSVTITKTKTSPANPPYTINDQIVYNIAVTNTGIAALTTVPLQDLFSSQCFEYVTASPAPSATAPGVLTWNTLGSLAPSATVNVSVTLKVKGNCDPAANTARVQGAGYIVNSNTYTAPTQESTFNINTDLPPVANTDIYCVQSSTALLVLSNDTDPDLTGFLSGYTGSYTVSVVSVPSKGTATVNGDKTIQFNPAGGTPLTANEVTTFTYRVTESAYPQFWHEATVTVLYTNGTTPPSANSDAAATTTELPVVIDVLGNDIPNKQFLQVPTVAVNPGYGTVTVNADKTVTYTPFPGFEGTDVFTYQICHSGCPVNLCATAQVTVTVVFAYYVCKEGSSTLTVNAVPGAVSYLWTLPAGAGTVSGTTTVSPTIEVDWTGVTPGNYNVCVTPTNDCGPGTEQCVNVTVNKVVLSATPTQILCYGENNGSINLTVSGGIEPYSYMWYKDNVLQTGMTIQDPGGLSPGTYKAVVTDKIGCTETIEGIVINQPAAPLSVSGNVSDENPYPSANGAVDLSVSGGTPSYTFVWSKVSDPSFAAYTEDVVNLSSGVYRVLVTDANGCRKELYFTVNRIGGPLQIVAVPLHVLCYGGNTGAIDLSVSGGISPYTYTWTGPGGPYTTQDLTGLAAGTYSVTVADSDSPSKTATTTVTVNQPASALSADISGSTVLCFGQQNGYINLTNVTGGTAPYTYLWNTGSVSQNLTGLPAGNYSVTITDYNGCFITRSFNITQSTQIVVTGVVTNVSCQPAVNGSIDLSVIGGSGSYTYVWSNGATTQDLTNLTPGTYAVTITDGNGCVTGKSFEVITACLVLDKSLITGPTNNGDGSYTLTFRVKATNTGTSVLNNVQIADPLLTVFAPGTFALNSVSSDKPAWLNSGYNGNADANLFIAGQTLLPGDEVSVNITITVIPGAFSNPDTNTATGTATDASGVNVTDQDDALVTFTENPLIGVAKALTSGPVIQPDGSFNLSFTLTVRNYGDVPLNNVQVTDNLDNAFGAGNYLVTGLSAGSGFTVNWPGFNGSGNINLLSSSTPLAINEIRTIVISLKVTPATSGPFNNQASATGYGTGGTLTTDQSQNGLQPDSDGDDDPLDNNDPTPVSFSENPQIGIAKQVTGTPVNNFNGTYTLTYEFRLKNTGNVALNNVQATDNLNTTFGGATVVVNSKTSTNLTVNSGYNGISDINLLSATGNTLAIGETKIISLTVTVTPAGFATPSSITYNNSAIASGTSGLGTTVTDTSQNGIDVDPENDGPGNNTVPTPVNFTENPKMGFAKSVSTPVNNNNGTYTVNYTIYVKNYGDVPLSNIQVTDDLGATLSGATSFTVQSVIATGNLTANSGYNGTLDKNLLISSSSSLAYNTTSTITITVLVTPGTKLGIYYNSASGTAAGPGGTPVSDISYNGTNPDPDGDGNPGNNSLPTPLTFTEAPAISVTKTQPTPAFTDNGNGTYSLTYTFVVTNTGNVPLYNVQLAEDLTSTFPGATFSGISITSAFFGTGTNANFNGTSDVNLLDPGQTLLYNQSASIQLTLIVDPGTLGGPYYNLVYATGESPAGRIVIDASDAVSVTFFQNPAISLTKSVVSVVADPDGTNRITFKLLLENTGDVYLHDLQIYDDVVTQFAALNPTNFSASEGLSLAVNPSWNGTATSTILDDNQYFDPEVTDPYFVYVSFDVTPGFTNSVDNYATAYGTSPLNTEVSATSSSTVEFLTPAISLSKEIVSGSTYNNVNDLISYQFTITNTGEVVLPGPFSISDDKIGNLTGCAVGSLGIGATVTCTGTYTVTLADLNAGSVTNTATATTTYAGNTVTSNPDQATAEAGIADISVTKEVVTSPVNAGGELIYKIVVTNAGPAPARNVVITDNITAFSGATFTTTLNGTYEPWNNTFSVPDNIPKDGTYTLFIKGTLPENQCSSVSNTVTVASENDTDSSDNTASTTTTVNDATPPVINHCPETRNIEGCTTADITGPTFSLTSAVSSYGEFSGSTNSGTATDNCSIVSVTYIDVADGSCPATVTRTWTVSDGTNSVNCQQVITIDDATPPNITGCGPAQTVSADLNCHATVPDFTSGIAVTDICSGASSLTITQSPVAGTIVGPGTHTITLTVVDACGNQSSCTTTLLVPNVVDAINDDYSGSPVSSISGGTAIPTVVSNDWLNCSPVTAANLNISLITAPSHNGVLLNTTTGEVTVAPGTPAGTYSLVYQICDKLNPTICDQATAIVTVVNHSAGEDKSVCLGGTVQMTASGAGTWTADPGNPGTATIVSANDPLTMIKDFSAAGTYLFTWTSYSGLTDQVQITVNSPPTLSLSADPAFPVCPGAPFTINAVTNGTITGWQSGYPGLSGSTLPISVDGIPNDGKSNMDFSFTVNAISAVGNCPASETISASVKPAPRVLISPQNLKVCDFEKVMLTATPVLPGTTVTWSAINHTTSVTYTGSGNVDEVLPAGSYTFTFSGTLDGCVHSSSVTVIITH